MFNNIDRYFLILFFKYFFKECHKHKIRHSNKSKTKNKLNLKIQNLNVVLSSIQIILFCYFIWFNINNLC